MLEISPRKVAHIIVRARELDAKVARWNNADDSAEADSILEARASDMTEHELTAFIQSLNQDEQASLVALLWIGRETFDPEDLEEAIATARDEATTPTEEYVLGEPLLSDYLESGLEKLGIDPTDAEDEIYARH